MIKYINQLLAKIFEWRVLRIYRKKLRVKKNRYSDLFVPRDCGVEAEYLQFWSGLKYAARRDDYRYYANISGIDDPTYMPKDLFYVVVERCLNDINYADLYADKNMYDRIYGPEYFPETVVRFIKSRFYTKDYQPISVEIAEELLHRLESGLVVKRTLGSCGGKSVRLYRKDEGGRHVDDMGNILSLGEFVNCFEGGHFVFQRRLEQSEFTKQFNRSSVNTFRVMTLRLPENESEIVVLKSILRMGVGDVIVDNEASGGISVGVLSDGTFSSYATDGNGQKVAFHPVTKIRFEGQKCLYIDDIYKLVIHLAKMVPHLRLLSWDVALDENNKPFCIEVNTSSVSIGFLQTFNGSLFGEYSKLVRDYCRSHRHNDQFKYLRTFY